MRVRVASRCLAVHSTMVRVALLLAMACGTAALARSPAQTSLVEAQLTNVEDVTDQPGSPRNCFENSNICIDGAYRVTFTVLKTLTGPVVSEKLTQTQASAQPRPNLKYLLVISQTANGPQIEWRGL